MKRCATCHKEFMHKDDLLDHLIGRHFWSDKAAQEWIHQ